MSLLAIISLLSPIILGWYFSHRSPQPKFVILAWSIFFFSEIAYWFGWYYIDGILSFVVIPAILLWMYNLRSQHQNKRTGVIK